MMCLYILRPVASFTKEVDLRLAKRPLKTNGRLANRGLTSLVKEATGVQLGGAAVDTLKPEEVANFFVFI